MRAPFFLRLVLGAACVVLGACRPTFRPSLFPTNQALYEAGVRELRARHWDNAITAFDRLTEQLPARDPLLPIALFDLGKAHEGKGEFILAAQSYSRIPESYPDDTLADDAMFAAGRSYARLWRKPSLDAEYGETARNTFRTLVSVYPNSPLRPQAEREIARLNEWFATKDYENGMSYFRRKGYESGIIYFKDIVKQYPDTPKARDAMLRLAESYQKIRYKEEFAETCDSLRKAYPADREVSDVCGSLRPTARSQVP